jgi:hypothetical protein
VRRALSRIDALPPGQMEKAIELTPFTVDGHRRGINLHIGESVLFNVLEGDLDPEEKIFARGAGEAVPRELGAALQAASAQRRPLVLLKGVGLSVLATAIGAGPALADSSGNRLDGQSLSAGDRGPSRIERFRWARHGWLLVQRLAQLLMGFLWLSVAYLWLTYVLARFPLTEPLGDRLTDFLFDLLEPIGTSFIGAMPALTTAVVILFMTKAFNDAIGNFFKAAKAGPGTGARPAPETVSATHRMVSVSSGGSASPSPTPSFRCPTATPSRACR